VSSTELRLVAKVKREMVSMQETRKIPEEKEGRKIRACFRGKNEREETHSSIPREQTLFRL